MEKIKICVIGLGYVGLPLARLFSTKYPTVGYDTSEVRVKELMGGFDKTGEIPHNVLQSALDSGNFTITSSLDDIRDCNFYIVAVPTPVDSDNNPDLTPLISASTIVGEVISFGNIVVYESTTYPGCTEEVCIPTVEKVSGLKFNTDFYCGYSPERINPGDKLHTVDTIRKVTSGSTPVIADFIDAVYRSVITGGTFKASSIKVAEASKIIENTQRDVNIGIINEFAKVFGAMGIDTHEVLDAASTKWNFIRMSPGLVGGHCISVDPYYLIRAAVRHGVDPVIMKSSRITNDGMGRYVADRVIRLMNTKGIAASGAKVLVLGITFKENCPDIRNTKVVDIISELSDWGCSVTVCDPIADRDRVMREYGIEVLPQIPTGKWDAVVLAVSHTAYNSISLENLLVGVPVVFDVKGYLTKNLITDRL